jgi:putative membrane protein
MRIPLVMVMVMTFATAAGAQSSRAAAGASRAAAGASRAASGDTAFAMKAAHANMAEIELGKLAQQKAMRDEVKQFAQRMVSDHSKKLDELKGLAASKNITLPTEIDAEHKQLSDRLSTMNGAAFDRAYMQAMVDGHRKVAADFRKESQSGSDPDLKSWAAKTLPGVEDHLKHAERVNRTTHGDSSTH